MIRLSWRSLLLMLLTLIAFGCAEDEVPPPEEETCVIKTYEPGVYISNEGPFTDGVGTITQFNTTNEDLTNSAFQLNNCDSVLGNIVQSVYLFESKAYIVVNNSNKLVVANGDNLEQEAVVNNLALPRYFLPVGDGKAFVSQWGSDGLSGSVAVVDLNSLNILTTIPTGNGPENMIRIDNKVYVANVGGYGRDSTVTVIDIGTESVSNTIVVGDNPQSFVVDNVGALWCLSKGYTDFYEPSNNTDGTLTVIENEGVQKNIAIPNGSSWLAINNAGNELFYLAPGGIFQTSVADPTTVTTPFITGNFYAMAIDFNSDRIYASDALDFSANGVVYRYELDGTAIDNFTAGIIPGGFWFD